MDISTREKEVLLKIYIGQNIRNEGVLRSDIKEIQLAQSLRSKGLIKENRWYRHQLLLTTDEGSRFGKELVAKRIDERKEQLEDKICEIPKRTLGFFIKRHISKKISIFHDKTLVERSVGKSPPL
jgi:hypothetical protein